jgi:ribosome-associated translation inhibitor RaiA
MNPNMSGPRLEVTPAIRTCVSDTRDRRVLKHKGKRSVPSHDALKTRAAAP